MRGQRLIFVFGLAVLFLPGGLAFAQTQQPQSPPPTTSTAPPPQNESSSGKKSHAKHQHDFLIKGTVFTQEGLGYPGAQIRIRKAGTKSFHWQDAANSRGEFAIRVVQGAKYEVVVSAKGCKEQTKSVDATGDQRVEDVVIHMEREGGKPS
jgi:Carboxypeptidase regulatory-like domain